MRNGIRNLALAAAVLASAALPAHADHDDWYEGDVNVSIRPGRGEGAVYAPGDHVRIEFRTDADAYHLVYAIDTEGFVRVLFPRFWEDDGWVPAGERVRLRAHELAWPADRWGRDGIVYVEAVASPMPFDWQALGVWADAGGNCHWSAGGVPLRVSGDPFLAFNDVHARIFPDWGNAVFAVDYSYFYVGARCPAPRYLGYVYEPVYVPSPHVSVHVRFGWGWDFGPRCARPVYRRYYTPGRHVVHHVLHHDEPRLVEPDRRIVGRDSPARERVERRRDTSRQRQRIVVAEPRLRRDDRGDDHAGRVERQEHRVRGTGQERDESVRVRTRARQADETTVARSDAKSEAKADAKSEAKSDAKSDAKSGRSRSDASKRTKERR